MDTNEHLIILETAMQAAQAATLAAQSALEAMKQRKKADDENKWVTLTDAAHALGSGISAEMLKDRCVDGRFKHGVHFINTSDGSRSNWLIRVSSVRKYFETEPEKRSPAKLRRVS